MTCPLCRDGAGDAAPVAVSTVETATALDVCDDCRTVLDDVRVRVDPSGPGGDERLSGDLQRCPDCGRLYNTFVNDHCPSCQDSRSSPP